MVTLTLRNIIVPRFMLAKYRTEANRSACVQLAWRRNYVLRFRCSGSLFAVRSCARNIGGKGDSNAIFSDENFCSRWPVSMAAVAIVGPGDCSRNEKVIYQTACSSDSPPETASRRFALSAEVKYESHRQRASSAIAHN